jgi:hypothetical protein
MVRQYEVIVHDTITNTTNQIEVFANNIYEAKETAKRVNAEILRKGNQNRYTKNILEETKVICIGIK